MSDNYEGDSFDKESHRSNETEAHLLKLSVDLFSVRNMIQAANLFLGYQLQLNEVHTFQQKPPMTVNTTKGVDTRLENTFAAYEFTATRGQLFSYLNDKTLVVNAIHQVSPGEQQMIGVASVPLSKILAAPLKQTPSSQVRVYDDYFDFRDPQTGNLKGNLRALLYLEDLGLAKDTKGMGSLQKARDIKLSSGAPTPMGNPNLAAFDQGNGGGTDYQAVWQLEMWKRAEEAKFKAYLKQREIEKIEEITVTWRMKEQERESTFQDSMKHQESLEGKLRQKSLDLQRREERIIQLEEELKHKIAQVSRQLASKEEEVMTIKKRFKEEKNILEQEKKKGSAAIEELKGRLEMADQKFLQYKMEIEQSPLNVLRSELAHKQIELVEMESRVARAYEARDEFKVKYEKVKADMVQLKRHIDKEKEHTLTKQAEELEQIKKHMRNQAQQDAEKAELLLVKQQLASMQEKLTRSQRDLNDSEDIQQAQGGQPTMNPFATAKNKYLDNFASNKPIGQTQHLQTPTYTQQQAAQQQMASTVKPVGEGLNITVVPGQANKLPPQNAQSLPKSPQKGPRQELSRLEREREELMEAGCYTASDPLIQEMDRQIKGLTLKIEAIKNY